MGHKTLSFVIGFLFVLSCVATFCLVGKYLSSYNHKISNKRSDAKFKSFDNIFVIFGEFFSAIIISKRKSTQFAFFKLANEKETLTSFLPPMEIYKVVGILIAALFMFILSVFLIMGIRLVSFSMNFLINLEYCLFEFCICLRNNIA